MNAPAPSSSASNSTMIARIWHGVTPAERADEYAAYLERTGVRECRATPGNRGVQVFRRIKQGRAEFTFISFWDSVDAIRRFAGDDFEKAHYYPEDKDFLIELQPFVDHFDVIATTSK